MEGDFLYPGQESGFALAELDNVVAHLQSLPGIELTGLTHFPCLLWDDEQEKFCQRRIYALCSPRETSSKVSA